MIDPKKIREIFLDHFRKIYNKKDKTLLGLDSVVSNKLDNMDRLELETGYHKLRLSLLYQNLVLIKLLVYMVLMYTTFGEN